jgi:hypothetical protein
VAGIDRSVLYRLMRRYGLSNKPIEPKARRHTPEFRAFLGSSA